MLRLRASPQAPLARDGVSPRSSGDLSYVGGGLFVDAPNFIRLTAREAMTMALIPFSGEIPAWPPGR